MLNTVSVMTTPEISSAMPMPITVTIGTAAFFSACSSSTRSVASALGVGGADVVLRQHLQHRGARDAGDQRHVGDAERHRRQDQALDERPEALADRPVALHRQPAALARRRSRSARSRRTNTGMAKPSTAKPMTRRSTSLRAFQAASDADRNGERHGDEQRRQRQRQGRLEPLGDQPASPAGWRRSRCRGRPAAGRQSQTTNCSTIGRSRPSLARTAAICLGGRVLAGDDRRRIARREAQQEEHEQRHHRHHRQRREQAAHDVGGHEAALPRPVRGSRCGAEARHQRCTRSQRFGIVTSS